MLFEQFNLEFLSRLSTYKQVAKSYQAPLKDLGKTHYEHGMGSLSLSKDGTALFIQMRCTVLSEIDCPKTTLFHSALKLSYHLIQMYFPQWLARKTGCNFRESTIGSRN